MKKEERGDYSQDLRFNQFSEIEALCRMTCTQGDHNPMRTNDLDESYNSNEKTNFMFLIGCFGV